MCFAGSNAHAHKIQNGKLTRMPSKVYNTSYIRLGLYDIRGHNRRFHILLTTILYNTIYIYVYIYIYIYCSPGGSKVYFPGSWPPFPGKYYFPGSGGYKKVRTPVTDRPSFRSLKRKGGVECWEPAPCN